jgi:hypothetical protein
MPTATPVGAVLGITTPSTGATNGGSAQLQMGLVMVLCGLAVMAADRRRNGVMTEYAVRIRHSPATGYYPERL